MSRNLMSKERETSKSIHNKIGANTLSKFKTNIPMRLRTKTEDPLSTKPKAMPTSLTQDSAQALRRKRRTQLYRNRTHHLRTEIK